MTTDDATVPPLGASPVPRPAPTGATHPGVLAHMNMLQAVITRLAGNSASCKTWCAGLVTSLLAFIGSTRLPQLLPLALLPMVLFAFLDANYLAEERRFRRRFEDLAAKLRAGGYADADLFNFGPDPGDAAHRVALWEAFKSWSVLPYYLSLLLLVGVLIAVGWFGGFELLVKPKPN